MGLLFLLTYLFGIAIAKRSYYQCIKAPLFAEFGLSDN